jgi:hypothetical protein
MSEGDGVKLKLGKFSRREFNIDITNFRLFERNSIFLQPSRIGTTAVTRPFLINSLSLMDEQSSTRIEDTAAIRAHLDEKLAALPDLPGVYLHKNAKAKSFTSARRAA